MMRGKPYFERELCFWCDSDHLPPGWQALETGGGLFCLAVYKNVLLVKHSPNK